MRVTSWNCSPGADVSRRLSLLAPLRSDLITLQECRRPAIDSASVIWRGTDPRQGVAVISIEAALRLESVETPSLHPTIVPVRVQAPQPFVFVWVWNQVRVGILPILVAALEGECVVQPVLAGQPLGEASGELARLMGEQSRTLARSECLCPEHRLFHGRALGARSSRPACRAIVLGPYMYRLSGGSQRTPLRQLEHGAIHLVRAASAPVNDSDRLRSGVWMDQRAVRHRLWRQPARNPGTLSRIRQVCEDDRRAPWGCGAS